MKIIKGGVCAAKGFKASGIHCGIRKNKAKKDLALIVCDKLCSAAAVYTTNLVKGAPVYVTKNNISDGYAQAVICNSGNANTCKQTHGNKNKRRYSCFHWRDRTAVKRYAHKRRNGKSCRGIKRRRKSCGQSSHYDHRHD